MWLFKVNSLYTSLYVCYIYRFIVEAKKKLSTELKNWFFFLLLLRSTRNATPAVLEFSNILLLTQHRYGYNLSACRTFAAHKMMFTSKPSYFFLQQWLKKKEADHCRHSAHSFAMWRRSKTCTFFRFITNEINEKRKNKWFALDYTTEI